MGKLAIVVVEGFLSTKIDKLIGKATFLTPLHKTKNIKQVLFYKKLHWKCLNKNWKVI